MLVNIKSMKIIILILVLICIGCAILSGTPYFKEKLSKITLTEKFDDYTIGKSQRCYGVSGAFKLKGTGGTKDCYTLEGKYSVPENFVKEPIFFDGKELILKESQNLSTSFRNNKNVFSITNKGNDDNYYFDIVRSPKLPPEPYVPPVNNNDTPAETITNGQPITPGTVTQTTSQSKQFSEVIQDCDGNMSNVTKTIDGISSSISRQAARAGMTQSIPPKTKDTQSTGLTDYQLRRQVGNDQLSQDEKDDILLHRFDKTGGADCTGTIKTQSGIQFPNADNRSIYSDNSDIIFQTNGSDLTFSSLKSNINITDNNNVPQIKIGQSATSPEIQEKFKAEFPQLKIGQSATSSYVNQNEVGYLNDIVEGRKPLILRNLTCKNINTPLLQSKEYYAKNVLTNDITLKNELKMKNDPSILYGSNLNLEYNNHKTVIDKGANINFGENQIEFGEDQFTLTDAELINGYSPFSLSPYDGKNAGQYLNIDYSPSGQTTNWSPWDENKQLDINTIFDILIVKNNRDTCIPQNPSDLTSVSSECKISTEHNGGIKKYQYRQNGRLIPIKTKNDLIYYKNMQIFYDKKMNSFLEQITGSNTELLERQGTNFKIYHKKFSENYNVRLGSPDNNSKFYINIAQPHKTPIPK